MTVIRLVQFLDGVDNVSIDQTDKMALSDSLLAHEQRFILVFILYMCSRILESNHC